MRKIKYTIGLLAGLSLASACECAQFVIDIPTTPKLVLLCCPGPADTTIMQLYKTVPVGNTYSGYPFLEDAKVEFKVNGEPLEMTYAAERVGSVPEGCWFVPRGFNAGDKVEVSAAVDGAGRISASTVLPPEAPEFDFKYKVSDVAYDHLDISFTDDSTEDDWYGVAVMCERTLIQDGKTTVEYSMLEPKKEETGINGVTIDKDYVDIRFSGWSFGGWSYPIRVWPDSEFGQKDISINLTLGAGHFTWLSGEYEVYERFKVRLYRFPREFFRYASSIDDIANNNFAVAGIAPMPLSFTNVNGGAGALAGWTMRETDWITNE